MGFFEKLKKWLIEGPPKPEISFDGVFVPADQNMSATEQIMRYGLPFHIRWTGAEERDDN